MKRHSRRTKANQINKPEHKRFSLERAKNKFLSLLSSKKSFDRNVSKKIFEIVPNNETNQYRGRTRNNTSSRKDRKKSRNKLNTWMNKSLFVVGNIRLTRFAVALSLLIVIILGSSSIVIASTAGVFNKVLPYENEDLIPAEISIYISDGEDLILHKTSGGKVEDMLIANGIELEEDDMIYPSLKTVVQNRMKLEIKRAVDVTVKTADDEYSFLMYGGTVADALEEAGIEYDDNDIIEPSPENQISDGLVIEIDFIEMKTVTEDVVIEFETEYVDEPTILKGYWDVKQKGKDGFAKVTYEVTYLNGEEQTRKAIEEDMIKEPVTKIVRNGTGLTRVGSDEDDDNDEGSNSSVPNPEDQVTNPPIPSGPGSYVESIVAHVTAYTHTGHTTAIGTWPRSTRTLDNPGSCAVVPATFPYGSLLYVPGYGYCIAEDTGGFRHNPDRWNQIDLFMNTAAECSSWGRRREWTIYVIRYGY